MNARTAKLIRRYCGVMDAAAIEQAKKDEAKPQLLDQRKVKRSWLRLPRQTRGALRKRMISKIKEAA